MTMMVDCLQAKRPENHNVKAKTRSGQQLQFLQDRGVVRFLGGGGIGRHETRFEDKKIMN